MLIEEFCSEGSEQKQDEEKEGEEPGGGEGRGGTARHGSAPRPPPGGALGAGRPGVDTLRLGLEDGLVGLVGVLHGDRVRELGQHPLLEGLEPLVVMPPTHKLLVLQAEKKRTRQTSITETDWQIQRTNCQLWGGGVESWGKR